MIIILSCEKYLYLKTKGSIPISGCKVTHFSLTNKNKVYQKSLFVYVFRLKYLNFVYNETFLETPLCK